MKCLIVAAGQGSRMRDQGDSKPLIEIDGIPILERVILNLRDGGIDDFYIVTGYRGTKVRAFLDELSDRESIKINHVVNEEWQRPNGLSVYAARDHIDGPFILTMCDHLFDPEIIRDVLLAEHDEGTVTLCVDYNIENPVIDIDDVTRVNCTGNEIRNIGKVIRDYNAFDTGIFYCTSAMFDALDKSFKEGDESITGAMNVLGSHGKARTFDVKGRLWLDVDDPMAFGKAIVYVAEGKL
ncbi:MAG: NTP transferase domain-containing protein [Kordiimonadaceae bacterium]|jgi:1L-myo-inositol 1-phosphate cytidylyltransferase|nr:NTP transferase domain-containing protein [Kordiimonadaceae bacterium]MDB4219768.1 NTP transferase domain-containing protein [Emcibacteraceae bacterium]MBT6134369.1 NTP transferase domain-containing protein [Kordiimonadaceae bacterium]MBT6466780.1 NTP transferase domain-containing protein [Kordiimonadaceae bacterium]MBT7544268.1 NTP transferase domain-containing protein [Kordiimonadaceae bacterium]|tara:strand:- start:45042 stop:45758 length:717 start_codon:yes stop_codon:yes gene_type:complete